MKSLVLLRLAVAITWLYQGLYLKLLLREPQELKLVAAIAGSRHAPTAMTLLGVGQTVLGVCVLIGLWTRPLSWVQVIAVAALYGAAISAGAFGDPLAVAIAKLPLLACLGMLAAHGPGRWHV